MLLIFKLRISHAYFLSNDVNEFYFVFSKCFYLVIKLLNKKNNYITINVKKLCVFCNKTMSIKGFPKLTFFLTSPFVISRFLINRLPI